MIPEADDGWKRKQQRYARRRKPAGKDRVGATCNTRNPQAFVVELFGYDAIKSAVALRRTGGRFVYEPVISYNTRCRCGCRVVLRGRIRSDSYRLCVDEHFGAHSGWDFIDFNSQPCAVSKQVFNAVGGKYNSAQRKPTLYAFMERRDSYGSRIQQILWCIYVPCVNPTDYEKRNTTMISYITYRFYRTSCEIHCSEMRLIHVPDILFECHRLIRFSAALYFMLMFFHDVCI